MENSFSITAAISPVKAPTLFGLMSCAPSRILESRIAFETSLSAVNGGQTTMSASLMFANSSLRLRTRSSASATVLFIFQFPAKMSFLAFMKDSLVVQGRDSRQGNAFQELKAGAAAGAHKGHLISKFRFVERLHAVTAANNALSILLRGFDDGASDRIRAFGKSLILEQSHRPIP